MALHCAYVQKSFSTYQFSYYSNKLKNKEQPILTKLLRENLVLENI